MATACPRKTASSSASSIRCFKCKQDTALIATREGPKKSYCLDCFTDFVRRSTRDALFRQCCLPPEIPVVLCVSGGVNSMVLMQLLGTLRQENLQRGGNGKIHFNFKILHLVEDGVVRDDGGLSSDHYAAASGMVRQCATTWTHNSVPLFEQSDVFEVSMKDILLKCASSARGEGGSLASFPPLEHSAANISDVEEEYVTLKRLALCIAAQEIVGNGVCQVLTAENGVMCCVRALGDLTRGKGALLPQTSGFRGIVHGCYHLRPLRSLLPKEVVIYAKVTGIPYLTAPTPNNISKFHTRSVNQILLSFVTALMQQYPSTPFNILNSISKMMPTRASGVRSSRASSECDGASASSQQPKFILTKAAQFNFSTVLELFAVDKDQLNGVDCCDSCGSPLPNEDQEVTLHAILKEQRTAWQATQAQLGGSTSLCYGCQALACSLAGFDKRTSPLCEVPFLNAVEGASQKRGLRLMTKDEVRSVVEEFLV